MEGKYDLGVPEFACLYCHLHCFCSLVRNQTGSWWCIWKVC